VFQATNFLNPGIFIRKIIMATSLAEIRARLLEQDNRQSGNKQQGTGDNAIFPFWNIPENSTTVLRFLPDGDETNTFPWRERQMIRLEFAGVLGGDENKRVTVTVPCMEMWKETCPIHAEIRPWFKDKSLEDLGRKYWKKKSYIFQGFVVDTKLQEDTTPENPIRRFIVNPSIFNIVKGALMDPEMDNLFTDFENGTDFRLTKTTKGQYADYSTSSFARKERGLNEVELQAIADRGLFNLNDFMPKKPTKEEVEVIYDMFKASVDGELYDPKRWGQYFKPAGVNLGNLGVAADVDAAESSFKAPAPAARPAPVAAKPAVVDDEDDAPFEVAEEAAAPEGKKNVNDILAMIRNRQQK
jgi:hypothetical protein